jgi:hypothetical protein
MNSDTLYLEGERRGPAHRGRCRGQRCGHRVPPAGAMQGEGDAQRSLLQAASSPSSWSFPSSPWPTLPHPPIAVNAHGSSAPTPVTSSSPSLPAQTSSPAVRSASSLRNRRSTLALPRSTGKHVGPGHAATMSRRWFRSLAPPAPTPSAPAAFSLDPRRHCHPVADPRHHQPYPHGHGHPPSRRHAWPRGDFPCCKRRDPATCSSHRELAPA